MTAKIIEPEPFTPNTSKPPARRKGRARRAEEADDDNAIQQRDGDDWRGACKGERKTDNG